MKTYKLELLRVKNQIDQSPSKPSESKHHSTSTIKRSIGDLESSQSSEGSEYDIHTNFGLKNNFGRSRSSVTDQKTLGLFGAGKSKLGFGKSNTIEEAKAFEIKEEDEGRTEDV